MDLSICDLTLLLNEILESVKKIHLKRLIKKINLKEVTRPQPQPAILVVASIGVKDLNS